MQNLHEITTLEALKQAVEAFEGCPLKANAKNTVFGTGNPNADIMLIGEAPGAQEDEQGVPFVGRSGQLLSSMLEGIGTSRKEVYITNVAFWRPPENRNPTPKELESCRPFVEKHIELVAPKIIVLVGNVPTQHMLKIKTGITKIHGQWQNLDVAGQCFPALPIFHPAYLLRNPPAKKDAWADFQIMRQKGEGMGIIFSTKQSFLL